MTTLLHALLVVGGADQLQVVARMTPVVRLEQCHIIVLIVGMHAMVPRRSLRQIAFYNRLVIVLFNVQVFIMRYAIS